MEAEARDDSDAFGIRGNAGLLTYERALTPGLSAINRRCDTGRGNCRRLATACALLAGR
jgi:hypothetical protein